MVPNIEKDYILHLGIVFHVTNIILLGSTTKENATHLKAQGFACYRGLPSGALVIAVSDHRNHNDSFSMQKPGHTVKSGGVRLPCPLWESAAHLANQPSNGKNSGGVAIGAMTLMLSN